MPEYADMRHLPLPIDPRDRGLGAADWAAPGGGALYATSIIPADSNMPRVLWGLYQYLDGMAAQLPKQGKRLSGDLQHRIVQVYQLPHSARPHFRAALRGWEKSGKRAVIVQAWRKWLPAEEASDAD